MISKDAEKKNVIGVILLLNQMAFRFPFLKKLRKKAPKLMNEKPNFALMDDKLLNDAREKVGEIFSNEVDPKYAYHNMDHTLKVVAAVRVLMDQADLSDSEKEMLLLAAFFHDSGFIDGQPNHEIRSANIADKWLEKRGYPEDRRKIISRIIQSTHVDAIPELELGKLLKDADLSGLASKYYFVESEKLRQEWENLSGVNMEEIDWLKTNRAFQKEHYYHSAAGKKLYDTGKKANQKILKKKIRDLNARGKTISKTKLAQTHFKTALRNHIDLSAIADNKANIMLSVNALIITVAMPFIAREVENNIKLLIPAIVLLTVCVTSMIYATLATRPIKMKGYVTDEEIEKGTSNLFFFGNFYMMDYNTYEKGIQHIVSEERFLDSSITRDLFFLGKSIGNKFANLRKCYTIFMYGMVIAVITFIIAFVIS